MSTPLIIKFLDVYQSSPVAFLFSHNIIIINLRLKNKSIRQTLWTLLQLAGQCNFDTCEMVLCMNGGSCLLDQQNRHVCNCPEGFTGEQTMLLHKQEDLVLLGRLPSICFTYYEWIYTWNQIHETYIDWTSTFLQKIMSKSKLLEMIASLTCEVVIFKIRVDQRSGITWNSNSSSKKNENQLSCESTTLIYICCSAHAAQHIVLSTYCSAHYCTEHAVWHMQLSTYCLI